LAISKAELKKLRLLKTKKGRTEQGTFMVGGLRVMEEALNSNMSPIKVLFASEQLSKRGISLIDSYKSSGIEISRVRQAELHSLSDTETSQGILGVFKTPDTSLSKLYKHTMRKVLLCDQINDPGNLGTLIRTALAFEFKMIMVTDNSVEIYNPKVVRSSAGAIFKIATSAIDYDELLEFKESNRAVLLAAVSHSGPANKAKNIDLDRMRIENVVILAIGSEAEGLSTKVKSLADVEIKIEHDPVVESLNAAVAGGVLMHQLYKSLPRDLICKA
jgi:TrmH family RNA methyltransferase